MTVYLTSDHGGFELKQQLVNRLSTDGYTVFDLGPATLMPDDDYPDYAVVLGERVAAQPEALGIAICRNGQGMCLAANTVAGIRAVSAFRSDMAVSTRTDDAANVLCLAADYQSLAEVLPIVEAWLGATVSHAKRHERRRAKVKAANAC